MPRRLPWASTSRMASVGKVCSWEKASKKARGPPAPTSNTFQRVGCNGLVGACSGAPTKLRIRTGAVLGSTVCKRSSCWRRAWQAPSHACACTSTINTSPKNVRVLNGIPSRDCKSQAGILVKWGSSSGGACSKPHSGTARMMKENSPQPSLPRGLAKGSTGKGVRGVSGEELVDNENHEQAGQINERTEKYLAGVVCTKPVDVPACNQVQEM